MKQQVVVLWFLVSSLYVTGVYSGWGLPFDIPGLSESVTPAFGHGVAPLLAVNASAAVNLARDSTGTLVLVQKMIGNVSEPLNNFLVAMKDAYTSRTLTIDQIGSSLISSRRRLFNGLGFQGIYGTINAVTYAMKLSTKISASVYNAIIQAIMDLTDSIASTTSGDTLVGVSGDLNFAVINSIKAITADTISNYVTPTLVNAQAPKVYNVISAIDNLAVAMQMAVSETESNFIDPVISSRLPNFIPLLGSFNASADGTRTCITQTGRDVLSNFNSSFSTVTSKPWNWNNGNIVNLTTFLANVTALVQHSFTQSLDAGINSLKTNFNQTLTQQVSRLANALTIVYFNISDSNASSSASFFAKGCVPKYNASLLSMVPSMARMEECVKVEKGTLDVVCSHAKEAMLKMKHDAIKSMQLLQLCPDQNADCAAKVFASFGTQYQRVVTTVTLIVNYTTSGLMSMTSRITDCTRALVNGIVSQAQTIQADFNDCLLYGY